MMLTAVDGTLHSIQVTHAGCPLEWAQGFIPDKVEGQFPLVMQAPTALACRPSKVGNKRRDNKH